MEQCRITIARERKIVACAKSYTVEVDGITVGKLNNGEAISFFTTDGFHTISLFAFGKCEKSIQITTDAQNNDVRFFAKLEGANSRIQLYSDSHVHIGNLEEECTHAGKSKLATCKTCGAEIAKSTKVCPSCGAKNKQRIGPGKIVLYVLAFFLVIGAISTIFGDDTPSEPKSDQSVSDKTPEEEATAILDKADSSFADGNYKKALSYCQQVKDEYSQTEAASGVEQFVADHFESYPNLTAKELCKQYDANQVNADNTYKDKPIVVSGKISDIGKTDITDSIYVLLDDGKNYSFVSVQCSFPQSQSDAVSQLEIGTQVKIVGTCDGESAVIENVILSDCIVIW